MIAAHSDPRVEIVVFRVGDNLYGADASQVIRIARSGARSRLSDALGMPHEGNRALVFRGPDASGELEVCIDEVAGIKAIPVPNLRRVPPAAGSPKGVLGFWLDGPRPVVLVELSHCLELPGGQ
jgi:chemotaxis signal transduction protein